MRRNGEPIREVSVRHALDTGITYSVAFVEWEAAAAAGLDLWQWDQGAYPPAFQAKVQAWYNLRQLITLHQHDAQQAAVKHRLRKRR